jgi:PKD repeat protein
MSQKIGKSGAVFLSAMLISVGVFGAVNLLEATPPTADAGVDQIVEPNIAVQFDGSSSIGDNLDYTWYFRTNGDVGAGMNPTHTFTEEGIYEVGLLVRETASSIMDLDITKITVRNQIPGADAGPDQVVNEDDIVTFDASGTTDTDSDLLGLIYDWDFADGAKGTGMNPTHVYTLAGTYSAILTVTDDGGAAGTDTVTITVNNLAPIANAGSDQTVNEGEYVYFDGSGSTDTPSDADSLRYEWNFGDLGPYAANYWKDNGVYPATLTVTDDDGAQNQNTIDVSVQNVDPFICVDDAYLIANITLCASGEKWHDVKFYLNESGTPREEFYVYREAGDPKEQEDTRDNIKLNLGELWTAEVYYTPLDDPLNGQLQGDTPVWIILEFDNGVTRKISHNFNVNHPETWYWNFALNDYFFQNPQPAIHFGYTVYDPGMDSETVTWECGGNTVSKYYEASTFPTLIKDTIDYTPKKMENITITVDDDDGGTYNVTLAFAESMLDGLSPKVSAGDNQSAIEDDTLNFAGSAETTISRSISSYQWKFGDGHSAPGPSAEHAYAFSGTYFAVLRAWDYLGNVGIDILKVEIINANPTAEAGLDKVAAEDSIVIFDGSGTTDTLSDISSLVYEWNFGDGSDGYGISPIHVYSNAGTYSVTLTVTDNDGATSTDTLVITVNNLAPTSALAGPDRIIYGASMSIEFVGVGFDTFSDVLGLVYNWNFGDGTPGTGKVTSHTYIVASTYTITLTVTDDNNAVATDTCTIFVGIDSDGDNLVDTFETGIGTDVDNWDSDTDYISDYWEIYTYDTDPALSDTDVDGLIDWYEIAYLGYDVDVDDDGLMCPRDWDSDGDWIKDGDDPNPLMYNYADGTEASGPVVISVNEYLGVYVVIEYEGVSTVKANIVEITPIKELNVAVGHYVDISTTSTVPFTAEIRFKYSMPLPPPTLEEQLALYQWHGANNKWVIEDNTVVNVDKDFVWSKVTHFCELCIGNSNFQYSDSDGLCDWYERNTYHPNFSDDLAYLNGKTNEFIDDTDGDGLYDGWEDLNGDGIFDDGETKGEVQYYTSPLNADTDDDDVNDNIDIDPLVDLQVTVKINEILRLDPVDDWPNEGADFYLWVICNDGNSEQMLKLPDRTDRDAFEEDSDHVYPDASATFDVVDDSELVGFMIILFDDDGGLDRTLDDTMASGDDPCDISSRPGGGGGDPNNWGYSALLLNYDLKAGQWSMEDSPGDPNGYGHASGEEDLNTGDQNDCELWFDITQGGVGDDGDGLTWWQECGPVNAGAYGTDPTDWDTDGDGLCDREALYMPDFNPLSWNDPSGDYDSDTLTNAQEINFPLVGEEGTDPTNPDTDGDELSDATDKYPLIFTNRYALIVCPTEFDGLYWEDFDRDITERFISNVEWSYSDIGFEVTILFPEDGRVTYTDFSNSITNFIEDNNILSTDIVALQIITHGTDYYGLGPYNILFSDLLCSSDDLSNVLSRIGPALDFLWLYTCHSWSFADHIDDISGNGALGITFYGANGVAYIVDPSSITPPNTGFHNAIISGDSVENAIADVQSLNSGAMFNLFDYYPGDLFITSI